MDQWTWQLLTFSFFFFLFFFSLLEVPNCVQDRYEHLSARYSIFRKMESLCFILFSHWGRKLADSRPNGINSTDIKCKAGLLRLNSVCLRPHFISQITFSWKLQYFPHQTYFKQSNDLCNPKKCQESQKFLINFKRFCPLYNIHKLQICTPNTIIITFFSVNLSYFLQKFIFLVIHFPEVLIKVQWQLQVSAKVKMAD